MAELKLCEVADVAADEMLRVTLDGRDPFAVYNVEGKIYVTADFCTHGKASLTDEGSLEGFTIICSWHDGAFDIRTGEIKARPCSEPLPVFPVTIRDGGVFITCD